MSFSISISGHARDKEAEAAVLDTARQAVKDMGEQGEVYSASFSSQYHKTGDLRDAPEVVESSPAEADEDKG